ncbi:type VI secretion system TssO [Bacteroides sp. 224]|uniref:type VI secretion system TssO n=1 Tax=Bacteroides sp. 224 TaxID=2302936 RepID=UPI0013CFB7B4|nr:type VI secretion system TssO [Bacteroides sp. 224]
MNKSNNKKIYVNRKERIGGLIYVLMFFIIGAGMSGWILLSQSDIQHVFSRKDIVSAKMKRQQDFKREQEKAVSACDLIVEKINTYDPSVKAVYEKNDIEFMINELRRDYEANRSDKRYMVYLHLADFYQMWFNDKQYLWHLDSNYINAKQNLEECELGLEKKKEEVKSGK